MNHQRELFPPCTSKPKTQNQSERWRSQRDTHVNMFSLLQGRHKTLLILNVTSSSLVSPRTWGGGADQSQSPITIQGSQDTPTHPSTNHQLSRSNVSKHNSLLIRTSRSWPPSEPSNPASTSRKQKRRCWRPRTYVHQPLRIPSRPQPSNQTTHQRSDQTARQIKKQSNSIRPSHRRRPPSSSPRRDRDRWSLGHREGRWRS